MQGINLTSLIDGPQGIAACGLAFSADACALHRHRLSSCRNCVESCPAGAIERQERVTIDPERCLGCGICATACPVGAIEVLAPSNSELLWRVRKRLASGRPVAFACGHPAPDASAASCIEIACLGRLDESILVGAVALGARAIWLVHGDCAGCVMAAGRLVLERVVANTQALLACFGGKADIVDVAALPVGVSSQATPDPAGSNFSRRRLLRLLAGQDHEPEWWSLQPLVPASRPPGPRAKGVAPPRASTKQRLLVESALRLGEPLPGARLPALTAHFSINAACSGCQMCALFCPTGALTKVHKGEQVGLAFQASLCTNCGLCREICYWKAVELMPGCDAALWVQETVEVTWFVPRPAPQLW